MKSTEVKLTQYSKGAGCGCKVAPAVLDEILSGSGTMLKLPQLLVGSETKDDAAAWDMGNGTALISTADFFTPIVNDAFTYGKIAAANALSDVYAMGGKPVIAIAILGFPVEKLGSEIAAQIIAGGKSICAEAGVALAGGHTIDAPEPFFGLAVSGFVEVKNLKKNSGAQEGDVIYLTKPLGTGALTTALKRDLISEAGLTEAVNFMCMLNSAGAELGKYSFIHALTDVTGFGLLGHLIEMCEGADLSADINYANAPLMQGVKELCAKFIYADNTMRNWKAYESKTAGIGSESLLTLCDPQTNGGLLIAVAPENEQQFITIMQQVKTSAFKIGSFTPKQAKTVTIK